MHHATNCEAAFVQFGRVTTCVSIHFPPTMSIVPVALGNGKNSGDSQSRPHHTNTLYKKVQSNSKRLNLRNVRWGVVLIRQGQDRICQRLLAFVLVFVLFLSCSRSPSGFCFPRVYIQPPSMPSLSSRYSLCL